MQTMDRSRWERVSPLLDELLDLDPTPRAERLAALSGQDPALGAELSEMLQRLEALEHNSFLQSPARLPDPGMAGQAVGAYTIVRELGRGGMGSVWLAQRADGRYEGNVAVKFLTGGALLRGSAERFAREGSILARLAHPNIARLIDAGVSADGQRYLVLEYIDGETIDRYCERMALDVTARVKLFLDVLAAVAHAHNRLILHRDIKPGNILVTQAGEVKLLDFGVAKLMDDATVPAAATELTQLAGRAYTPAYAAPEQVQDGDVTTATDVYALGVLLYGLLGGGHPTAVPGSTTLEQLRAVVEAEPRRLSEAVGRKDGGGAAAKKAKARARELRGDLDNIVAKALKKVPGERYANAQLMAEDLRRYLGHEPVAARADAPGYVLAKFVRRHQAGAAASVVVAVALLAGLGIALREADEARRQRLQAEGLIEFMLGDLRKKLQPVGRLDVLDAVGEKVLAHYESQSTGRLDAEALGRQARALHLIGEMAETRGRLEVAQSVFRRAADSTAELLARAPQNTERVFNHAQSEFWVSYLAYRRARWSEAELAAHSYLGLAKQLALRDPSRVEWQVEFAAASSNLGVIRLHAGEPADALKWLEDSLAKYSAVTDRRPELMRDAAITLGWIAKAREALGQFTAAIEAQAAKLQALQPVSEGATNRSVQSLIASARYETGRLRLAVGQFGDAADEARAAVKIWEDVLVVDPSNQDRLATACHARLLLAEALSAQGQLSSANAELTRVENDANELIDEAAVANRWHVTLRGNLVRLKSRLKPDGGLSLAAFVKDMHRVEVTGEPWNYERLQAVTIAELLLGDVLQHRDPDAARSLWQRAADRMVQAELRSDPSAWTLLAAAWMRLGRWSEALALADRIEQTPYRHPAYSDLRQRLAAAAVGGAGTVIHR